MWQIRIHEPSGESRIVPIQGSMTLGRGETASVCLRDPTVAREAAVIWAASSPPEEGSRQGSQLQASPFWIRIPEGSPNARLADIAIREAQLPSHTPLVLGETEIQIEPVSRAVPVPSFPSGVRPWLTVHEEGREVLWTTKKSASTHLSIYLAGETGTGKEVLAHLVHGWSQRASGPFVPLHCGALPLSLAESELFGHVKGAFTGATHHRSGALMQAHGGTLFLDEIGDLPLDIQVKLLRFLENGEIRPVGADRPSRADVRILCATHHPLQKLVEEGKFRRDLYYRLASITIQLPPLRQRPDDIEMLAKRFASELERTLTPKAILRLQAHQWPGNVRELRHTIERATGLAGPFKSTLGEDEFSFLLTQAHIHHSPQLELNAPVLTLHEMERIVMLRALKIAHGNRARAARILGVARSTLFEMLKRHRIQGPKGHVIPSPTIQ